MALVEDSDKFLTYRYEVKDFYFTLKDSKTKMKGYKLKSLIIINDYIENVFPIIQLKVSIDYDTYYKIIRNKDNVKIRIRIQKYYTLPGKSEKSLNKDYLDTSFSLILDDDDEDLYADVRKKNNVEGQDSNDLKEQANEVEFYLFKSSLVKASKKRINKILEDCNVTNAIAIVMKRMGIKDLLMSKASNTEIYNMIIPPLKATQALAYIDTFYGIHDVGSILFFGIERSYLLRYEGRCSAWEQGEIKTTTIIIPKAGSMISENICSLKKDGDDTKYYLVGDYNTIEFQNQSVSNEVLTGEEIHIVNSSNSSEETTSNQSGTNKTIVVNRGVNKYFKSIYKKRKQSLKSVINVQFSDIDLDALTPNKKFNFVFEDSSLQSKYKGTYILVKTEIGLIRKDSHLSAVAKCVFRSDD